MKKNSLSKEILNATIITSSVTIILSAITFIVIYLTDFKVGYAFMGFLSVSIISLIFLSIILTVKCTKKISEKINSIDLANPYANEVYEELSELRGKIIANQKETTDKLSSIEILHREQDNMRRDFTANVSHELKTPLTSIKGYSELIKDGLVKAEDIPNFATKIHDESQRLITLVGDIIKLSQLDGNDIQIKIEDINLYEMSLAIIEQLELQAKEKKVTFNITGDKPVISGGEQIVEEMLFNIIDNAVKYNKEGGQVNIKIRQRIDGVEYEVSDTGIGIAEGDIPHIFERFWRADKSHSKEIGGTGLGLSIVKHGAKFFGAGLSVDSKLGEGTTIRIVF